jgi:hypothetical protein
MLFSAPFGSAMPPKAESRVLSNSQKNHHEADDKYRK